MEDLIASLGMFAVVLIFFGAIALGYLYYLVPIRLWITAIFSGVRVRLVGDLVGMRLRRVPPDRIIMPLIAAHQAGIDIDLSYLEAHYMAGGDVPHVVRALISAQKAGIDLTFEKATAIDLAGRDVFEAVQVSVNPRVINTPPIMAVARDGVQLQVVTRVTVRANIARLVGGAGEATIMARVGEGIVSTIGSANSHADVLENPSLISKKVLDAGLDSGTAFEILSIDIADVDVVANIGAKLQIDQANADLRVAMARSEERRAAAIALQQEMKAEIQEQRAKLVEAESMIPMAMSDAFRAGRLLRGTNPKGN